MIRYVVDVLWLEEVIYLPTISFCFSYLFFFFQLHKKKYQLMNEKKNHFGMQVIFSCLEKLELFSTNIKKIWPDCFLATSGCQNLTNLIVDCCGGLKFLCSSSMVNSLVQLKELKIRDCLSMEGVVNDTGLAKEAKMTEMVFPRLVFLELNGLPKLTRFATGNSVQFPSLVELFIDDCPNLEDSSLVVNVQK